jgi:hypothetical protein
MGTPHKEPKSIEKVYAEAFVIWLNGIEFKDDDEMFRTLNEIESEVTTRLSAMGEDAIDKAEAEGS